MVGHIYTIEFRVFGDNIISENISHEMNLCPSTSEPNYLTKSGRKREAVWGYNGRGEEGFRETWENLDDGLTFIFEILRQRIPTIRELAKNFRCVWWCGHFQKSFDGGPLLSKQTIDGLQEFGIPIFIDCYFSS